MDLARGCDFSVAVAGELSVREFARQCVHNHVAGSGVEGDHIAPRLDHGDVRDTPNIESDSPVSRMPEEQGVDVWDQRSAFAARRDVAGSEIRDYRHAR